MAGSLLDPAKVQGPRLQDTKVKGADYGTMRPIVYGKARIGGIGMGQGSTSNGPNQFTEHEEDASGKGGPEVTNYRYTLSFFDEMCEGPIGGVLRRWANGRMVTDVTGHHEAYPATVYLGTATQMPDPTMQMVYPADDVNPMRGVAYEALEEIDVTPFGNARPVIEREVFTTPLTRDLRIIQANYDTLLTGSFPIMVDWPASGDIAIAQASLAAAFSIDLVGGQGFSLTTFEPTNPVESYQKPGYNFPNGEGDPAFGWHGLGMYQYTDHQQPLWQSALIADDIGTYPPCLSDGYTGTNVLDDAGVPGNLFLVSACLSQDGTQLWAFTSPIDRLSEATQWWKIVEGIVVDDGTVAANAIPNTFYGVQCAVASAQSVASFENNGRYMWLITDNLVNVFYIDDDGVFDDWGFGDLTIPWTPPGPGYHPTVKTLALEGYAGTYFGNSMVLLSRIGEPEAITLGEIVEDLLLRADRSLSPSQIDVTDLTQEVRGFIVGSQMTVRNAIDVLRKGFFFDVTEYNGKLVAVNRGHDAIATIPDADLCAHEPGGDMPEPLEVTRVPDTELPRTVFITYYDVDQEYQPGSQYWRRTVTRSQSDVTLDLPIVFTATEAFHRAQWHMHFAWLERERFVFLTTRKWTRLVPTDVVIVRGVNIRITNKVESPNGLLRFEGVRAFAGPYVVPITDDDSGPGDGEGETPGGPPSGQPPQTPPGPKATLALILLDVPPTGGEDMIGNTLRLAVYKQGGGTFSGGTVYKSIDGGVNYTAEASIPGVATVGTVATALPDFFGGNVVDAGHTITVVVSAGTFTSNTDEGFYNGQGLIALGTPATGWEMIQYRTATLIAADTWELSGLLRGRLGSEWRMGTHAANELLVLMNTTVRIQAPLSDLGVERKYKAVASGTALADATVVTFTNTGVVAKPPAPVLMGGGRNAAGDVTLSWVPRNRGEGYWPDGTDLPLLDRQNWQIEIATDATFTVRLRAIGLTTTSYVYTAADQTTDLGSPQNPVYWRVAQFGAYGLGYYAEGST